MECGEHVHTFILFASHEVLRGALVRPGCRRWFEPWDPIGHLQIVGAEVDRLDSITSFSRTMYPTGEQKGAGLHIAIERCVMHQIGRFEQCLTVSVAEIWSEVRK